ncbi:MAG: hypothetical protein ACUVX9_05610 [Anaerolineae bacterium]
MGEQQPFPSASEGAERTEGEMCGARQRLGREVERGLERMRLLAADGLSRAASRMRASGDGHDRTAQRFAESLDEGAAYLRRSEIEDIRRDLSALVHRYPAQTIAAAFVAGWLLGRAFRRR